MRIWVLFLLVLLLELPGPVRAGTETIRFTLDGLDRRYQLTLPEAAPGPLPLVVVLHGAFQNDKRMAIATRGQWADLAEREGFAMAMVSAVNRLWDVGQGEISAQLSPRRDDVAYLDAVMAQVRARAQQSGRKIDADRIFFVGYSLGGQMTFAYGCQRPQVGAMVSVAMPLPLGLVDRCRQAPLRPVLLIHGTADPIVPFTGGKVPAGPSATLNLLSHEDTRAFFARRAGCGAAQEVARYDAQPDGTAAILVQHPGCRAPVWGLRIEGHGHRWPGGGPDLPQAVIGPATRELDAAQVIWRFLSELD